MRAGDRKIEDKTTEISTEIKKKRAKFPKKGKRKWMILIVSAAVVIAVAVVPVSKMRSARQAMAALTSSVREAEAEMGNISTTISSTGTLANDESASVSIPEGIKIKKIYVSAGDTVKKGQKLASIDKASAAELILDLSEEIEDLEDQKDDVDDSSDTTSEDYMKKLVLESRLEELEATKETLLKLYESGKITAGEAGVISSVNVSEDAEVTQSQSAAENTSDSTGSQAVSAVKTSSDSPENDVSAQNSVTSDTASVRAVTLSCAGTAKADADICLLTSSVGQEQTVMITDADLAALSVRVPKAGEKPQDMIAETDAFSGSISWDCGGSFQAGKTYTATILLTAKSGYAFADASNYTVSLDGAVVSKDGVSLVGEAKKEGNQLCIQAVYETEMDLSAAEETSDREKAGADSSAAKTKDAATGTSGADSNSTDIEKSGSSSSGSASTTTGGNVSGSISAASQTAQSSAASETDTSVGDSGIADVKAFTIASKNSMVLEVSVDELDINSVKEGQTAVITMDAFENQEFQGTISDVGTAASTNGGSSKYTVSIALDKEDGMLEGMSASAVINIKEAENVILIPSDALMERRGTSYVYTKKEEDGTLSGETEVETGLSDGTNVEITDGLSAGDTVYYQAAASEETGEQTQNFEMKKERGDMPSQGMPSGDNLPFGGSAPSGGGQNSGQGGSKQ